MPATKNASTFLTLMFLVGMGGNFVPKKHPFAIFKTDLTRFARMICGR